MQFIKWFPFWAALVPLLMAGNCYKSQGPTQPSIDVTPYISNLTQMAAEARFQGDWNSESKVWEGVSWQKLGGADAESQGLLPAYVPVMAGDCSAAAISTPVQQQVSFEVWDLVNRLATNEATLGKRNNLILVGQPGRDVDARVQVLAWRIAKGCTDIPESWRMRQVISVDLGTLKTDAFTRGMSAQGYMRTLRKILELFGKNAIYYLNDFSEVENSGPHAPEYARQVKVDDVLKLFLEHDANVIIEATPLQYNLYFGSRESRSKTQHLTLAPLPSEVVLPAIAILSVVEGAKEKVHLGAHIEEDIVRMSRALLPATGALTEATRLLDQVVQDAMDSRDRHATRPMVLEALFLLNPSLSDRVVHEAAQSVLNRKTTLSEIDWNVSVPGYYIDVASRAGLADAISKRLDSSFDRLATRVDEVKKVVRGSELRVLLVLEHKTALLRKRIRDLGSKVDARAAQSVAQTTALSQMIVEQFEVLSSNQDSQKQQLLNAFSEGYEKVLDFMNDAAIWSHEDQAQYRREMLEKLESSQAAILAAIQNANTKANEQGVAILERIVLMENRLGNELSGLGDDQLALMTQLSSLNGQLAGVAARLSGYEAFTRKQFETILGEHELLSRLVIAKFKAMSTEQREMATKLSESESKIISTLERKIDEKNKPLLAKLTAMQEALNAQGKTLLEHGKKLDEATKQQSKLVGSMGEATASLARLLKAVETEKAERAGANAKVQAELDKHQADLDKLSGLYDKLSEATRNLQNMSAEQVRAVQTVAAAQAALTANVTTQVATIGEVRDSLQKLNLTAEANQQRLVALATSIGALSESQVTFVSTLGATQERINTLQGQIETTSTRQEQFEVLLNSTSHQVGQMLTRVNNLDAATLETIAKVDGLLLQASAAKPVDEATLLQQIRDELKRSEESKSAGRCHLSDDVCNEFNTGSANTLPIANATAAAQACKAKKVLGAPVCMVKTNWRHWCARSEEPDPCTSFVDEAGCQSESACRWSH